MFFLERGKLQYTRTAFDSGAGDRGSVLDAVQHSSIRESNLSVQAPSMPRRSNSSNVSNPFAVVVEPVVLRSGAWLAEPALWLEWVHKGRLVAESDSCLLTLESLELAAVLREYRDALAMVVQYAQVFLNTLSRASDPTDIL